MTETETRETKGRVRLDFPTLSFRDFRTEISHQVRTVHDSPGADVSVDINPKYYRRLLTLRLLEVYCLTQKVGFLTGVLTHYPQKNPT